MNHALRRRRALVIAALQAMVLALAGLVLPGAPVAAAASPGAVVSATAATLPAELSPLATGKRITYVTTAVDGSLVNTTGLVLTPKTGKTNKTVVWGHGTTGLADQCAPSANQGVFWPEARTAVAALLGKGFTVAAPDYPGLGTPYAHPYLIGLSEARSMIDAVRAARKLDGSLGLQYAIDGHSQGGQGALFAGEIAPAYDGTLVLRGVSAIAPVSNADVFAPLVPGTPANGYLVMGLYGLQTVDSTVNAYSLLAPPAQQKTPVLQSGCLYEILTAYQSLSARELLVGGKLPDAIVTKLAQYDNPAQSAPSAPILLVQGTADESVPYDITLILLDQLNAYDQPVQFVAVEGATHDSAVVDTADQVATWIAGGFA